MDGVQTVESLRALDPDIEVIVCTGYASVETAVACMKHGAYDYIQKPYDLLELKLLLERASQKNHLQGIVTLYEASRALLSTLKHTDLVRLVLMLAQRVLRADDIGLLLRRRDSEEFDIHRLTGADHPSAPLLIELTRRVTQAGAPLRLPFPAIPKASSSGEAYAYSSALVYPLTTRDRFLGALVSLRRSHAPDFSASELQKGTVFASQLAVSLDNARLYDELAQKVSELIQTREQLVNAEKLAMAGHLAGIVAHEVNNPLAFVQANLASLRDYSSVVGGLWLAAKKAALHLRSQDNAVAHEHARSLSSVTGNEERTEQLIQEIAEVIDETLDGVKRIAELVAGFKGLASPHGATPPEQVDVNALLQECVAMVPESAVHSARTVTLAAQPCLAFVAPEDLRSALINLLRFVGAPEHRRVPRSGALLIRSTHEGGQPAVIITDETLVLSEEERSRIFDPRLEAGRGSRTMRLNLTLALTYLMLRRNGGEVSLSTDGAQRPTFRVLLAPLPK
jgi:FixJ family two-component response regulator